MKLERTGVIWYQPHARVQIIPFSSWHPWARAAWLGAFYLSKEERLCGGSPCFLAAVTLSCSLHGCPHSISWPSVSSRSTAGPRNQLTSSRTDLFSRVPTERSCAVGNILRTWAPCCQRQYCVHLMEVPGVCLCDLGTLSEPKGLATNKESLSPWCRSQLAPLRHNLTSSIFTKAEPQTVAGLNMVGNGGQSQEYEGGTHFFFIAGDIQKDKNHKCVETLINSTSSLFRGVLNSFGPSKALSDLFSKLKGKRKSQWFQHLL